MKNVTFGLQAFLVLAVAVLFYLHFSAVGEKSGTSATTSAVSNGNFRIAYFEGDSIQTQFEYFKEIQNELQSKAQTNSKELGEMKNFFNKQLQQFQQSAHLLSQAEQAKKQQDLLQTEKAYQTKEKLMSSRMSSLKNCRT